MTYHLGTCAYCGAEGMALNADDACWKCEEEKRQVLDE